jgi:anti-sigma B factor antagonist
MTEANRVVRNIRRENDRVILELSGDVDLHHSMELRAILLETLQEKPSITVINMSEVSFMDSSGLATLVEAMQLSRRNKGALRLVGLNQRVRSIFEISRLDKIFHIYVNEAEALAG